MKYNRNTMVVDLCALTDGCNAMTVNRAFIRRGERLHSVELDILALGKLSTTRHQA